MDTISSFRALHAGDRILMLPNAWDAASAALVASVGASAIATTSAGLAWACGYPDGNALPPKRLLAAVADICRVAGTLPVTIDIEEGYSDDAARVAELVAALRDLGVAGINIEDGAGDPEALERKIAAIKAACDVFVNARTDVWFRDLAEGEAALREACARGRRYALAGADGFFVPGIENAGDISAVAREVRLPLNVLSDPGLPTAAELYALGVRRISAGIGVSRLALGTARVAARAFLNGDVNAGVFAGESVSYGEMNAMMQIAGMPDFRGGKRFPRRGRLPLGRFLWLARVFDKARAAANETIADYVYPCPIDRGMMDRWGTTPSGFNDAVREHRDDAAILRWAESVVSDAALERANSWLVTEKFENLDRQDREEGAFPS